MFHKGSCRGGRLTSCVQSQRKRKEVFLSLPSCKCADDLSLLLLLVMYFFFFPLVMSACLKYGERRQILMLHLSAFSMPVFGNCLPEV